MSKKGIRLMAAVAALMILFAAAAVQAAPPKGTTPAPTLGAKKSARLKAGSQIRPETAVKPYQPTGAETDQALKSKVQSTRMTAERPSRPDHLLVSFKPGTAKSEVDSLRNQVKGTTVRTYRNGTQLIKFPKGSDLKAVVTTLTRSGKVRYAEPDYLVTKDEVIPNDYYFSQLWGLQNTGQDILGTLGTPGVDINATNAWSITMGSPEVVVAVIDTGVDINHPELKDHIWTNPGETSCDDDIDNDNNGYVDDCHGWDFVNNDNTVFDWEDEDAHGTHVSGTIAATINNGIGVAGVAPNVKIMPVKFLGTQGGYISDGLLATDYALSFGVKLANNSWGGGPFTYAEYDQINSADMLFVAAAGNDAQDDDLYPHYPSAYDSPNIISVAALANTGDLAYYSNWGATSVDVGAPGHWVLSSVPKAAPWAAAIQNDTGVYKSMFWGFSLEDMETIDARDALNRLMNFFKATKDTPVLVVEDDESDKGEPAVHSQFQAALSAFTNVTFLPLGAGVNGPILDPKAYPVVIWATGHSYGYYSGGPVLNGNDLQNIANYLNDGGNFFLTGQDALFMNEGDPVVTDMLGVNWIGEGDSRVQIKGSAGGALDGVLYALPKASPNYRDYILPVPGHATAKAALSWEPVPATYDKAYAYYGGTSMAAPHVTGLAALLMSLHPDWSIDQIKAQILNTVKPLSSLNGKTVTGGLIDAYAALNSSEDGDIPGIPYPGWGQTITDELDGNGSDLDDVYRVTMRKGQQLTVELHGAAGTDFDLYVYGPTATTVNDVAGIVAASESATSDEKIAYTAPSDGDYYIDAFGYAGQGKYTLKAEWGYGPGTYQENSPAFIFDKGWTDVMDPNAYGGNYKSANAAGVGVDFHFYGHYVEIYGLKGPTMGLATVTIDGSAMPDVDLYASTTKYKQLLFRSGPLTPGVEHTLRFQDKGVRSPAARRTAIAVNLDQVVVRVDTEPPAAVTELHGKAYSNKARLLWPAANTEPDFDGYVVYRTEGTSAGTATRLNSTPVRLTGASVSKAELVKLGLVKPTAATVPWAEFWDETALNGKDYTYWVKAVDAFGNLSAESPKVTVHPDVAPANIAAATATSGNAQITLTWDRNTEADVTGYTVYRRAPTDPVNNFYYRAQVAQVETGPVTFTDTGLTNDLTYQYLLYAQDKWGVESETGLLADAHPSAPPATPAGFAETHDTALIHLTWKANTETDLKGYQLDLWNDTTAKWEPLQFANATAYEYAITDKNRNYTFGLTAMDTWGLASPMATVTVKLLLISPPAGLTATAGDGKVDLAWLPVNDATVAGYNVYQSFTAGGTGTKVNSSLIKEAKYAVTGLTDGTTYYFTATTVTNAGDESIRSAEVSATPKDQTPPAVPTELTATKGNKPIAVKWKANPESDLAGYNLYRSTTSGTTGNKLNTALLTTNAYNDNDVVLNTSYYYSVTAVDKAGNESAQSAQAEGKWTDSTPPDAPTNLKASAGDAQAVLTWTASTASDLAGYKALYATAQTGPWTTVDTKSTAASYTLTGLTNGTTYWLKVQAVDADGNVSVDSNVVYAMPNTGAVSSGYYEDNDSHITYLQAWGYTGGTNYSGQNLHYSNAAGAEATLVFSGTGIQWLALKSPYYGKIDVYIDGVKVATVDLYASSSQYQQVAYQVSGLTPGVHQIRLVRTGEKNPSASSYRIDVDAFRVE
ncbi:MAG: S8 family serine peptidase [Mycobacterium leprae]